MWLGRELRRHAPIPRRGVGCCLPRGRPPVRDADPRGGAGRPVLVDHPQQAGELPAGPRRVRSREGRPVPGGQDPGPAGRRRDRPQPTQGPRDGDQRPGLPDHSRRARLLRRVPLGVGRRDPDRQPAPHHGRPPRPDRALGPGGQGPQATRLHLRRVDHRLLLPPVGRSGRRPPGRLPEQGASDVSGRPGRTPVGHLSEATAARPVTDLI